jgi:hypothetical protein
MDDLTDEPRVGVRGADRGKHGTPELRRHGIGGVEPPTVRPPAKPVAHHSRHVVGHRRLSMVQRDQLAMALEGVVLGLPAARGPAEAKPAGCRRSGPARQRRRETGEAPADVVEDAVEQDAHAAVVGRRDQAVEVAVVTQAGIQPEMVDGVVAMGLRREDRAQGQSRAAELDRMVQPGLDARKAVLDRRARRNRPRLGADETERVHLPPDRAVPGSHRPSY